MYQIYVKFGQILYPLLLPLMRLQLRRTDRVYALIVHKRKVLLVKNWLARNTWRLPGGGTKKGESSAVALIRELREEIGIMMDSHQLTLIDSGQMSTDSLGYGYQHYAYKLETADNLTINRWEIIDYCWVSVDKLPSNLQQEVSLTINNAKVLKLL